MNIITSVTSAFYPLSLFFFLCRYGFVARCHSEFRWEGGGFNLAARGFAIVTTVVSEVYLHVRELLRSGIHSLPFHPVSSSEVYMYAR